MRTRIEEIRTRLGLAENASFEVIQAAMSTLPDEEQWDKEDMRDLKSYFANASALTDLTTSLSESVSQALAGPIEKLSQAVGGMVQEQTDPQDQTPKSQRLGQEPDDKLHRVSYIGSDFDEWEDSHFALAYAVQCALHQSNPSKYSIPTEKLRNATAEAYPLHKLAMDTAETGYGAELVAAETLATIWRQARSQSLISSLFDFIQMPAETTGVPIDGGLPEFKYVSESTSPSQSNFDTSKTGTGKRNLVAKKMICHQMWSGELEEDSIVPFIPFLRNQLALSVAYHLDSLCLNGDTTNAATGNINLDDADPADDKHYLALDGIRHLSLVTHTDNAVNVNGAIGVSDLIGMRANMKAWGLNPQQCVYIMDMSTFAQILELTQVLTVDKLGPTAVILTGQLAAILGSPIIVSDAMSLTEADGKVSNAVANNTKGQIAVVNRTGWLGGWRRQLRLEFERIPATDQSRLVASMRVAFINWGNEVAGVSYNITV